MFKIYILTIYFTEREIDFLLNHLYSLGFEGDFSEYIKLLNGESYNTMQETFSQIVDFSHNLSYEFNNPLTTNERKKEIIDMLCHRGGLM